MKSLFDEQLEGDVKNLNNSLLNTLLKCIDHEFDNHKDAAYALAKSYPDYVKSRDPDVTIVLKELLDKLDLDHNGLIDYIFAYTHYDECNNGFFFRRS